MKLAAQTNYHCSSGSPLERISPRRPWRGRGQGVGRGETFIIASSLTQIAVCMNTSTLKKLNKL